MECLAGIFEEMREKEREEKRKKKAGGVEREPRTREELKEQGKTSSSLTNSAGSDTGAGGIPCYSEATAQRYVQQSRHLIPELSYDMSIDHAVQHNCSCALFDLHFSSRCALACHGKHSVHPRSPSSARRDSPGLGPEHL